MSSKCKKFESTMCCDFKEQDIIQDFVLNNNEKEEDIEKDSAFLSIDKKSFLFLPQTPENLIGSYLFYFLQPQKGLTTPLFAYDANNIIWTIASKKRASYESIYSNPKVMSDYLNYIPILSLLGISIKPENFVIVFDKVSKKYCSVQPLLKKFFYEKVDESEVSKVIMQKFNINVSFDEQKDNLINLIIQRSWLLEKFELVSESRTLESNNLFLHCKSFFENIVQRNV